MGQMLTYLPFFFLGVAFSDMESMATRPLNAWRDVHWGWKIPINAVLLAVFIIYGSNSNDDTAEHCFAKYDDPCEFYQWVTWNGFIGNAVCQWMGALAIIFLALTSQWTQWVLETWPCQFLGRISYSLYLIHQLIVDWCMRDTYNFFVEQHEIEPNVSAVYVFLIYTPVLILASWLIEFTVDTPSKNFSRDLDIMLRRRRPPPPADEDNDDEEDEEDYYSCWRFTKRIWPVLGFLVWLVLVFVSTRIYTSAHTTKVEEEGLNFDPAPEIMDFFKRE